MPNVMDEKFTGAVWLYYHTTIPSNSIKNKNCHNDSQPPKRDGTFKKMKNKNPNRIKFSKWSNLQTFVSFIPPIIIHLCLYDIRDELKKSQR